MAATIKYYRFYNKKQQVYGAVFAICAAHKDRQIVPASCKLEEVELHIPVKLTCSFCEVEKWLHKEKQK